MKRNGVLALGGGLGGRERDQEDRGGWRGYDSVQNVVAMDNAVSRIALEIRANQAVCIRNDLGDHV